MSDPAPPGEPRPFALHRTPPAPAGRARLVAAGLGVAAVGVVLVGLLAGRGTSALSLGPLLVTPGVGLGPLRFGQASVADAERLLGAPGSVHVQRNDSQSFGPDGAGPITRHGFATMVYPDRGVVLCFSTEVDASFDEGGPAHREMFERYRRLPNAPLDRVEVGVRGTGVVTDRGLRIDDGLEELLQKHGVPARMHLDGRDTRYLYLEGLIVTVEAQARRVTSLSVSPPFVAATLDRIWRAYEADR